MNEYYTNTRLDIRVDPLPETINDADEVLILYRMPNGTHGEWAGQKLGTQIQYITAPSDIPTVGGVGTWCIQACPVKAGVRKPGKVGYLTLKKPLN